MELPRPRANAWLWSSARRWVPAFKRGGRSGPPPPPPLVAPAPVPLVLLTGVSENPSNRLAAVPNALVCPVDEGEKGGNLPTVAGDTEERAGVTHGLFASWILVGEKMGEGVRLGVAPL